MSFRSYKSLRFLAENLRFYGTIISKILTNSKHSKFCESQKKFIKTGFNFVHVLILPILKTSENFMAFEGFLKISTFLLIFFFFYHLKKSFR